MQVVIPLSLMETILEMLLEVFGRELFMPIDVMFGWPYTSEKANELAYVQGLHERLEDAYDVAREHLKKSTPRQKRYYDIWANEKPYQSGDNEHCLNNE